MNNSFTKIKGLPIRPVDAQTAGQKRKLKDEVVEEAVEKASRSPAATVENLIPYLFSQKLIKCCVAIVSERIKVTRKSGAY